MRSLSFEQLENRQLLAILGPAELAPQSEAETLFYWSDGRQFPLHDLSDAAADDAKAGTAGEMALFADAETGARLAVTDEIVVALRPGNAPERVFTDGFSEFRRLRGTPDQYVVTTSQGAGKATIVAANLLHGRPEVAWAVPNFYHDFRGTTSDPLLDQQWHLHNTGQTGAVEDADVDLPEAWAMHTGGESIVIAVLDDGVQTDHPDLHVFDNGGEIPANGVDDDHNGWIDDVGGWDFYDYDNDPNPATQFDNHGTAVAGVAAAVGNNALGVSGAAQDVQILPIKIARDETGDGTGYADSARIAEAIYYAAGRTADGLATWRGADILVTSWAGGAPDPVLTAAFDWAAADGRGGLGAAVFSAAGNEASGYGDYTYRFPAGDWVFEWRYEKDASGSFGSDTAWLGDVVFPNGTVERFDSLELPAGWSTGGDASWRATDDPAYVRGMGRYAVRAGAIGHDQVSVLRSPTVTVDHWSKLEFRAWVSCEEDFDRLRLYVSGDGGETFEASPVEVSGVPAIRPDVGYPASLPSTIAVGASTDFDYRADYSQYGGALDFVAPSNGGFAAVTTTDRTGTAGYNEDSRLAVRLRRPRLHQDVRRYVGGSAAGGRRGRLAAGGPSANDGGPTSPGAPRHDRQDRRGELRGRFQRVLRLWARQRRPGPVRLAAAGRHQCDRRFPHRGRRRRRRHVLDRTGAATDGRRNRPAGPRG